MLKHIPVVQDARGVCRVGQGIEAVLGDELQLFVDIQVGLLHLSELLQVRNVHEQVRVQEVGIVDVAADSHDIRIVLPDKPGFQDGHCLVG